MPGRSHNAVRWVTPEFPQFPHDENVISHDPSNGW